MRTGSSKRRQGIDRALTGCERAFRHFGLLPAMVLLLLPRGAVAQEPMRGAAVPRPVETAGAPTSRVSDRPKSFGPLVSRQRMGASDFSPVDSSMTYGDLASNSTTWSRYPTNGNAFGAFVATVHLPSGALFDGVEFDVCDESASSDIFADVQTTTWAGTGATVVGFAHTTGTPTCNPLVVNLSDPIQIDNFSTQVLLVVYLPTHDGTTSISGAILNYHLQVSGAPSSPTFNDVPTDDFGFQYVEALRASGITGGCGGGSFCPDSPVTRRQMAIFLAKALGLAFH
jgi:hypothetical protein